LGLSENAILIFRRPAVAFYYVDARSFFWRFQKRRGDGRPGPCPSRSS
jgi:hypothetical protein